MFLGISTSIQKIMEMEIIIRENKQQSVKELMVIIDNL